MGAGWFLDEVKILVPSRGEQYVFACHRWLAKDEADGLLEIEMDASYKEDMEKSKLIMKSEIRFIISIFFLT